MNFDFSDEEKQLKSQARKFLDKACSSATVRKTFERGESFHRELWNDLGALGFLGAAIPEAYGGSGAGALALCVIAEELGRALAPVPSLSSLYLSASILAASGSERQKDRYLPALASGKTIATVALHEKIGRPTLSHIELKAKDNKLSGIKRVVGDGAIADIALVCAKEDQAPTADALSLYLVDLRQEGVRRRPEQGLDLTAGQATLEFANALAERVGGSGEGRSVLTTALDKAAVFVAFEQIGGADRALEMAKDYALERYAFGRPIGSFQAIKHMLADMYVSATLARSNAYFGAWAMAAGDPSFPVAAATARVSATQAYQHCAKNNIQVHGGMGFTWESDCHLHYRRAARLGLVLGSLREWEDLLISRLVNRDAGPASRS